MFCFCAMTALIPVLLASLLGKLLESLSQWVPTIFYWELEAPAHQQRRHKGDCGRNPMYWEDVLTSLRLCSDHRAVTEGPRSVTEPVSAFTRTGDYSACERRPFTRVLSNTHAFPVPIDRRLKNSISFFLPSNQTLKY